MTLRTRIRLALLLAAGAASALAASPDYYPPPDSAGGWRALHDAAQIRKVAGIDAKRLDHLQLLRAETLLVHFALLRFIPPPYQLDVRAKRRLLCLIGELAVVSHRRSQCYIHHRPTKEMVLPPACFFFHCAFILRISELSLTLREVVWFFGSNRSRWSLGVPYRPDARLLPRYRSRGHPRSKLGIPVRSVTSTCCVPSGVWFLPISV